MSAGSDDAGASGRAGDSGATEDVRALDDFGARLARHAGRVRLLVAHLAGAALRRRVELDDLVQDVFLRAVRDRERAPGRDSLEFGDPTDSSEASGTRDGRDAGASSDAALGRWLAELARHAVIDAARAARAAKRSARVERLTRASWSTVGLAESALAAETAGPATRAGAAEDQAHLERAFAALPADQRRVLALRQFESLSAAAVGRRMGRSETAVHSLYRRALLAWRAELDRLGGR